MVSPVPASTTEATLDAVREIFSGVEPRDFAIRLWDGTEWKPAGAGEPAFILVLRDASVLRRLLRADSEAALADAYLTGDIIVEGDLFAVPAVGRAVIARQRGLRQRARVAMRLLRLPRTGSESAIPARPRTAELRGEAHSVERDRAAVVHHYDLSNNFYSLFLDPRMVYSCAVFADREESLEAAQLRKLDLICRKLRLRPGDRLLDIGCGWGALIIHAAGEYGVEALGITVSERQAELARQRIGAAGLEARCRVYVTDYRTLAEDGAFDRVASVGMFEHVGRVRAPGYFATIHRLLRPGGTYLHHAITGSPSGRAAVGTTVAHRYVFPDHELIPLGETLTHAEGAGFDIRDVENLREHYALTLRRWIDALEAHHAEAAAEVGEPTLRAWRLVFAGAAWQFEEAHHGLVQVLMARPRENGVAELPLQRNDWYADS